MYCLNTRSCTEESRSHCCVNRGWCGITGGGGGGGGNVYNPGAGTRWCFDAVLCAAVLLSYLTSLDISNLKMELPQPPPGSVMVTSSSDMDAPPPHVSPVS
ncbi:hypothetical protein E2C01_014775 [Portunus trituberculatus]|uniref:Uncharacterized protein n=1 Tax=Portunus trituberculatus TaxID=210409 RepID=A0A5B7DJZ7_PORTR|nr:hypothetical protein [Portunus trituberculatus]